MNQIQELVAGNRDQIREVSTGRFDGYMVSVDKIRVRDGFNDPRAADPDYPAHLRAIADSIKANGFQRHKALVGQVANDGFFYLSDGHTRFAGVLMANTEGSGIESLPVINEMKGTNDEDRLFGLITNNNGKPLTMMGEGIVIAELMRRGIPEKEIARRLTLDPAAIANRLTLISAPLPVRQMVNAGEVSATTAIKAVRMHKGDATEKLAIGVAAAKQAGKSKATAKHMPASEPKAKSKQVEEPFADTLRMDFLISKSAYLSRIDGKYRVEIDSKYLSDPHDDPRAALDDAMNTNSLEV